MASNNILPFSHLDDEEFALMLYELQNGLLTTIMILYPNCFLIP